MSFKSYVLAGAVALVLAVPVSADVAEANNTPEAVAGEVVYLGTYYVETGELVPPADFESHIPSVTLEFETRIPSGSFYSVP